MSTVRAVAACVGLVTFSISAMPFAQVRGAASLAEVEAFIAQPSTWTQFQMLVNETSWRVLLPRTLEAGWQNPVFRTIAQREVWLTSPDQFRDLLMIDEDAARLLQREIESRLSEAQTKRALLEAGESPGADERLAYGEIPPELSRGDAVIGGPKSSRAITVSDWNDFVVQFRHAVNTRRFNKCDVEFCLSSGDVASYALACGNTAITVTSDTAARLSFSATAGVLSASISIRKQ